MAHAVADRRHRRRASSAAQEFGAAPWEDPTYYREISPLTYADGIRTPLLIQHAEQDLRTHDRPGRGAVHRAALARAGRSASCASPTRPTS